MSSDSGRSVAGGSASRAIRIARRHEHAVAGAIVFAGGAVLALALLYVMARTVSFPPVRDPHVVGWSTVHGYPEYQEGLYFLLALIGVPAAAATAWLAWAYALAGEGLIATGTNAISRWTRALVPLSEQPVSVPPAQTVGADAAPRRAPRAVWFLTRVGVPALLYWILFEPAARGALDPFHDGEFLVPLLELRHGGVPYRDVYLQHGLLHNALIPWLGAALFQPTVEAVWLIRRLVEPLGAVALYFFALTLFRGKAITAAVLAFLLCGTMLVATGRATFAFLALALVSASIPTCRPRLLGAAGLLTALAFWHSVEIGLYTGAAIGTFLLIGGCRPRRSALGAYSVGIAVGLAAVSAILLLHGALDDLAHNLLIQTAYQGQAWGLPFPNLFATLASLADPHWPESLVRNGMLFYLPAAVLIAASTGLTGRLLQGRLFDTPADLRLLLLVLAGAFFFRSVLGRSDGAHLHYGVVFMTLLALYVPDRLLTRGRTWPRLLAGVLAAFLVGSYAWGVYRPWAGLVRRLDAGLGGAGVAPRSDPAQPFAAVVEALQSRTQPGERVFDYTNQGVILFLADRPSATRYFHANYAVIEAMEREMVVSLERLRPVAILESGSVTQSFDGIPQAMRTPLLDAWLRENYERLPVAGTPYVLGIPRPAAPSGSPADASGDRH